MINLQPYLSDNVPDWVGKTTDWYHREETIHKLGKILTAVGVLLAAGTIASALILSGHTVVIGVIGGGVSLSLLFFGIYCIQKKEFWNDPAYKQKNRERIITLVAEKGYRYMQADDKEMCEPKQHGLVSKRTFEKIVLHEHYKINESLGYLMESLWKSPIEDLLNDKVLELNFRKEIFLKHIKSGSIQTASQFVKKSLGGRWVAEGSLKSGWEMLETLFKNKVITADLRIKNNSQTIQEFFESDVGSCKTLSEVYDKFGDFGLTKLIELGLISSKTIRDKFLAEYTDNQAYTQSFRYEAFERRYIEVPDLWKLLDLGVLKKEDCAFLITQEYASPNGFEKMLESSGWKPFELGVINSGDQNVRTAFQTYLEQEDFSFSHFCNRHHAQAKKYGFLSEDVLENLYNRFDLLRKAHLEVNKYYDRFDQRMRQEGGGLMAAQLMNTDHGRRHFNLKLLDILWLDILWKDNEGIAYLRFQLGVFKSSGILPADFEL